LKLNRLDEALEHFNTALMGIPSFTEYLIGRGKTYLAMGRAELAVRDLEEGLRQRQWDVESQRALTEARVVLETQKAAVVQTS